MKLTIVVDDDMFTDERKPKPKDKDKPKCIPRRNWKLYRVYLADKCSRCGFIPEDQCQLDIDHIDGNHQNDTIDNLRTLCANCHRLISKLQRQIGKRGLDKKPRRPRVYANK